MSKETAVSWLVGQLLKVDISDPFILPLLEKQAKEIEKDQMKKIAEYWHFNGIPDKHFEEYYNEIYNK